MMLTPSLPMLPPPPSSLLPTLTLSDIPTPHSHPHPHSHHAHHHRRQKPTLNPRSTLSMLTVAERSIAARKLAIGMYGYSWLKPAGCAKTMLGRREEEVEREEVERQLREVEMQERMAVEAEEQERLARLAEGGEPMEGRDLDDDVPEAEVNGEDDEEEEGMDGDLDDEIPDADEVESGDEIDESRVGEGWVYDTNREPDSDESEIVQLMSPRPGYVSRRFGTVSSFGEDERAAMGIGSPGFMNDIPGVSEAGEMDFEQEDEMGGGGGRDLDDQVPDADEGGWEHTDSELEDSEMDISILPGQTHLMPGARRSSGLPQSGGRGSGTRVVSGNTAANLQATRNVQGRLQAQTPQLSSDMVGPDSTVNEADGSNGSRRSWLHAASARRNLFGMGRSQQNAASGRFFTPSPAQGTNHETREGETPRRSGRFLGRRRGNGENRDSVD